MLNKELKKHITKTLQQGLRYDNRGLDEYRPITVELGISKNAEGSARVKIGETQIIAGVKMAIEKPYPDKPEEGMLMVNAELTPMASPDFEAGPPGDEAIEIARVVDRGIRESKAIDLKKLCLTPGEKAWTVMIDIVTINDDGNLMDAAALAAMAAVKDAKFPGMLEGQKVDYKHPTKDKLPVTDFPIAVTVIKIGDKLICDPSIEEKEALDARLTVTTMKDGQICAMQKGGEGPLTLDEIGEILEIAQRKSEELRSKVKK
ncbi:MAG: exosome complex protein Rrp42 [Nanoarchaeota archaeon]|nr:MAG: exosome complex protein Rrp42 [Nanoarchaeota archaeon]